MDPALEAGLHWMYVAFMALGVLIFAWWMARPKGVPYYEYAIAIAIPLWSGAAYMAIALGYGQVEIAGHTVYYARYLDWVVTTPLLLLALALTAMFYLPKDKTLIASLMGADAFMILCGLVADLTLGVTRYIYYGLGCAAFLLILWLIWVPLRAKARSQGPELSRIFDRVAGLLTVLWIGYPTVWILGPSGLELISQELDVLLFVTLPIVSKVGWSLVDLSHLRSLSEKKGPAKAVKETREKAKQASPGYRHDASGVL